MGEILALNRNDINLLTNMIYVTKTVYFVNNTSYINTTKTRSGTRNITINQKLAEMLKDWKVKQKEKLEEFTKNMIDKKFRQILERDKDLKKIRIHDLRHSHVSLLINQGEDYQRLGHASITTTIDTYSHLYPSEQKSLANKLDDLF